MLYSFLLPGGISADLYKAHELKKLYKLEGKYLAKKLFIDRLSGLTALLALSVLLVSWPWLNAYSVLIVGSLCVFCIYLAKKNLDHRVFTAFMISLIVQSIQGFSIIFFCIDLGLPDSFKYVTISLVSAVVAMLPVTLGGIGSRELSSSYLSDFMGVQPEYAVLAAMIMTTISIFAPIIMLPLHFDKIIRQKASA